MGKRLRSLMLAGAMASAMTLVPVGVAAAAPGSPGPSPQQIRCGYYEVSGGAYYGHCDEPPRTDVIIHVDTIYEDYDLCVMPGTTTLGPALVVNNAWYTGRLCWAG